MPPRILVTGGNGFVGRHLLALVLREQAGADVHAWQREPAAEVPAPRELADRVTWTSVELLDRQAVRDALCVARPDEVYHLAGIAHVGGSWQDPAATLEVNVVGTHVLLDELRRQRLDARVLVTGSATVYAAREEPLTEDHATAPSSPYALSKLAQELLSLRAWRDDGQQVLVVRAFNHIGPGQHPSFFAPGFARQLASIEAGQAPPVIRVGNLEARRDLTDVRDTVAAYRALMARGQPGRPYNVCRGLAVRVGDVLDALRAACRVPVTIEVDTARLRPNDTPLVLGSFARLQADTGWMPTIPFEQTLRDVMDDARRALAAVRP